MYYKLQKSLLSFAFGGWFVIFFLMPTMTANSVTTSAFESNCELVILADVNDPYYPLAEEIARSEECPIAHNVSEALDCHPIFLVWVASPPFLSDSKVIEFGSTIKKQSNTISTGIITSSTIENARDLWNRRTQVQAQKLFAVNATYPSAHVYEGRIIDFTHEKQTRTHLTKESVRGALQTANYLTFTGHGGNAYLKLDEDVKFTTEDIPSLPAIVVGTGSCQTLRPWEEESISRKFIDQGVAAYSGFVYSPIEGYLMGEFDGLPFRYTWSDFPIGHVIQVQNRGTMQGFAAFPFQYLLGDPRISLQTAPSYQLIDDQIKGDRRILTFRKVPTGIIPIRVPNGAAYHFVSSSAGISASDQDFFYNSHLQMVNIQNDKFILLMHQGGDLTLRLRLHTPWYWFLGDVLLDSLDHTFIFNPQSQGDILALGFAIIPVIWVTGQFSKKRYEWKNIRLAIAIGIAMSVLQGIYVLVRLDQITIISKIVVFSPLGLIATFVLGTCGTLMHLHARSLAGKITSLLVMTFPSWSAALMIGLIVFTFNAILFAPQTGVALYNYSIALLPAIAFLATFAVISLVLHILAGKSQTSNLL